MQEYRGNGLGGVLLELAVKSDNPHVTSGWGMESAPTPVGPVHSPARRLRVTAPEYRRADEAQGARTARA